MSRPADMRATLLGRAAEVRADLGMVATDIIVVVVAYSAGVSLRLMDSTIAAPTTLWMGLLQLAPAIVGIHLLFNVLFDTYGHVWPLAGIWEARRVASAGTTAAAALVAIVMASRAVLEEPPPVSLSAIVIGGALSVAGMGLARFRSRLMPHLEVTCPRRRAIVVGTNRTAVLLANHPPGDGNGLDVVGFVENGHNGDIRRIADKPVLGDISDLAALVSRYSIDEVIVVGADDDVLVRQVVDGCLAVDVHLRMVTDVDEAVQGQAASIDVRDIRISDLLPRPTVATDLGTVSSILQGRKVMVTGAGGSIGREILEQTLALQPAQVIALDHDDTFLHDVCVDRAEEHRSILVPVLASIRHRDSVMRAFERHEPDVVFHAAALKHVPLLETHAVDAFVTNVLGTKNLLEASLAHGTDRFVMISTDKAVQPTSVMGATKRIAEMLTQTTARRAGGVFTVVRFGNVLGSRGSVVPTFLRQIERGGPVTLTDPDMTRYFMTVGEAVQLVLQAAAIARGGEVFVLDMGEAVGMDELARRLIRLAGLVPDRDIEIRLTGTRPGEKRTEALAIEPLVDSGHTKIRVTVPSLPPPVMLLDNLEFLTELAAEGDEDGLREALFALAGRTWPARETVSLQRHDQEVDPRPSR